MKDKEFYTRLRMFFRDNTVEFINYGVDIFELNELEIETKRRLSMLDEE